MWTIGERESACLVGTCPIEPTGKDAPSGCMAGKQPAGSEFIILVKGSTGGKSLVLGRHPKESLQTSMKERESPH